MAIEFEKIEPSKNDNPNWTETHPYDAWAFLADVERKYTREWDVRKDINVTALAHERSVQVNLVIGSGNSTHIATTGPRNVKTMRQLARAINDACDFVEKNNPKWAASFDDLEETDG